MKKTVFAATLLLASSLAGGTAFAQGMRMPFNDAGVTMGHWHLNSSNIEASKKIFVGMGGKWSKPGDFDIVTFPGVIVNLHLRPGNPAPTWMVGKSIAGRSLTGSSRYDMMPNTMIPRMISVVVTGRLMKISLRFMTPPSRPVRGRA